jgi:hypothetical protein
VGAGVRGRQLCVCGIDQLLGGFDVRIVRRRAAVEFVELDVRIDGRMLHERHAFALDSVRDYRLGSIGDALTGLESTGEGPDVIAIAAAHMPSKRRQLCFQLPEVTDFLDESV